MDFNKSGTTPMAKKSTLNQATLNTISHYKTLLQRANIEYQKIIAFGSQAKGESKPWSDIDVGVISTDFNKDRHRSLVKLMQVRDDQTLDIEPHPLHPDDFNDKHYTLAQEVKKFGIEV